MLKAKAKWLTQLNIFFKSRWNPILAVPKMDIQSFSSSVFLAFLWKFHSLVCLTSLNKLFTLKSWNYYTVPSPILLNLFETYKIWEFYLRWQCYDMDNINFYTLIICLIGIVISLEGEPVFVHSGRFRKIDVVFKVFYIVTVCDVKPLMQTFFTSREGIR